MASAYVQRVSVPFEYPVYFTEDVFAAANHDLVEALSSREPARRHRALVVVDGGVATTQRDLGDRIADYAAAHRDRIELVSAPVLVAGGEASKNDPREVTAIHRELNRRGVDRQSFVIIVGGGAVLDMVGFAAAIAHRGVRVVRVPTTVLSQADSAVGVKNGVNHLQKKNFLGTFAPPFAVLIDPRFLRTLSPRDAVAGMAEAVKVALIRDPDFFAWIRGAVRELSRCEVAATRRLVRRCAELHLEHISTSGDPFELGSSRPLDFGHWAAHKLEALSEHRLRHGEAVSIGMAIDTLYAVQAGLCDKRDARAVLDTLRGLGLPLWDDTLDLEGKDGRLAVVDGLAEFREHLGGELTITLVRAPGRPVEVHAVDLEMLASVIARLRAEHRESR
jgi:3-dehydroquinate synthase